MAALRLLLGAVPENARERLAVHLGRPDLRFSLSQLCSFGYYPKHILDGGAYHGNWTRECLKVWPEASVLCVEPQDDTQKSLSSLQEEMAPRVTVVHGLLGPKDQVEVPFNGSGTGASVFTSSGGVSTSPMLSIDSLVDRRGPSFDFVKLDVQGYELQVLSGFERHLHECSLLQLELSLLPIVEGAPLIADVVVYLHQHGFVMFDINELIRAPSDGAVWQIDAFFCPENSPLRTNRKWRR